MSKEFKIVEVKNNFMIYRYIQLKSELEGKQLILKKAEEDVQETTTKLHSLLHDIAHRFDLDSYDLDINNLIVLIDFILSYKKEGT